MYCIKCETNNEENNKYCIKCGAQLQSNNITNTGGTNPSSQPQPQQSVNYANNQKGMGISALVLGIVSIVMSFLYIISIPVGIVGLVLGIISRKKNSFGRIGIILSIVGLSLSLIAIIVIGIIDNSIADSISIGINNIVNDSINDNINDSINDSSDNTINILSGDGYSLRYNSDWKEVTLSGEKMLKYKSEKAYLGHAETSVLSDLVSSFDTDSDRKKVYQKIYDSLNAELSNSMHVYGVSNGFIKLTSDIYYAIFDCGTSSTDIKSRCIVLISSDKNAEVSFVLNASQKLEEISQKALELLKNITIYDKSSSKKDNGTNKSDNDTNVITNDNLNNTLNALSNWNRYKDLRKGKLGNVKSLNGSWRILNDYDTCWKFKNGQFWWYKSVDDLNDNYWYGTYKVLTGKSGLKTAGLDESSIDRIVLRSSGSVTENDIYTLVLTPTKIISGGVDKSSTNLPDDPTWTYVWILVDHGAEGIEAQIFNVKNYDTSYFVKISD